MKERRHETVAIDAVVTCLKFLPDHDRRLLESAARLAYNWGRTDMIAEIEEETQKQFSAKWPNE